MADQDDTNPPNDDDDQAEQTAAELNELEDKYKRAVADLANYKRQVETDKTEFAKFASEKTLTAILPILDNFKRAAEHIPADLKTNDWVKGVAAIEQQFEQTLSSLGLKKIAVKIGSTADPAQHQPIGTGPGEQGVILEILEDGYELHGKVISPTKVKIGDGEASKK